MSLVLHLLLFHGVLPAKALPATFTPSLTLSPNVSANAILSNVSTASIPELTTLFNSSLSIEIVDYRVPNTPTILRFAVEDTPIPKFNLGRTILQTQTELRTFITENDASEKPLMVLDDPYESSRRWTGCFFGIATMPPGEHHLTYGIVYNVLQGLWLFMYRGQRYKTAIFEVFDDRFGGMRSVGFGKLTPGRVPDLRGGLVEES